MTDDFSFPEVTRIGVLPAKAEEALALFEAAGFDPHSVERSEGSVTYVFKDVSADTMPALIMAIPFDWWSNRAVVGRHMTLGGPNDPRAG